VSAVDGTLLIMVRRWAGLGAERRQMEWPKWIEVLLQGSGAAVLGLVAAAL